MSASVDSQKVGLVILELQIIVGSTRPTRSAELIIPWLDRRAREHGAYRVEVLDLRDWDLPMFAEHPASIGNPSDPTYSAPIVRDWNRKIQQGDAYLVVTPEYNHSVSGVLKNAIDSVFASYAFRNKPIVAVGYSAGIGAGIRAVEHLAQISIEAEAVPLRSSVLLPYVRSVFDSEGEPTSAATDAALNVALDDLAWWGHALRRARSEGELPPGKIRIRAATPADGHPTS